MVYDGAAYALDGARAEYMYGLALDPESAAAVEARCQAGGSAGAAAAVVAENGAYAAVATVDPTRTVAGCSGLAGGEVGGLPSTLPPPLLTTGDAATVAVAVGVSSPLLASASGGATRRSSSPPPRVALGTGDAALVGIGDSCCTYPACCAGDSVAREQAQQPTVPAAPDTAADATQSDTGTVPVDLTQPQLPSDDSG